MLSFARSRPSILAIISGYSAQASAHSLLVNWQPWSDSKSPGFHLAVAVDMQLTTADNNCQFVVLQQRKPYLVVWAIRLEEFPLQVRAHIAGINPHPIPPSL